MSKVTIKSVQAAWPKVDAKLARYIVRWCNGTIDAAENAVGQDLIRRCYNRPSDVQIVLTVVNAFVGGHGVEGTPWETDGGYRDRDFISYVNMGDTYAATIVWSPDKGYRVESWGDAYERSPACRGANDEDGEA